jgi:hypothetical protein
MRRPRRAEPSARENNPIHVFETLEDVREPVRACIARTNAEWPVKKNGYLSPHGQRRNHELAVQPMAA